MSFNNNTITVLSEHCVSKYLSILILNTNFFFIYILLHIKIINFIFSKKLPKITEFIKINIGESGMMEIINHTNC